MGVLFFRHASQKVLTKRSAILLISAGDRPLHTAKCCNQYVLRVCFHQGLKFAKTVCWHTFSKLSPSKKHLFFFPYTTQWLQDKHRARKLNTAVFSFSSRQFAKIKSKSSILKSFIIIAVISKCMLLDKLHFITLKIYFLQATIQSWMTVL